ncbi:MAG: riboflavin kinase, partial [Synergistaceae bacterium]|nr:riboflavin kinase [Synergistaceae bacterium]
SVSIKPCGALSIGNNPTFHDVNETRAEVFITDFHENIYGSELLIFLLGRIRGIKIFENKDALMAQINNDVLTCQEIYNNALKIQDTKKFLERAEKIYYTQENFEPEIINIKSCL